MKLTALLGLIFALASLAAGCGGDSNKKAAYGTPMSKAEFTKAVNARCKTGKDKVKDPKTNSLEDIAAVATQAADVQAAEYTHFNETITPPAAYEATWRELLSRLPGEIAIFREMAAAAEAGDQEETDRLLQAASEASEADKAPLRKIGLDECAA